MDVDDAAVVEHVEEVLAVGFDAAKTSAPACIDERIDIEAALRRGDLHGLTDEVTLVVARRAMNRVAFRHVLRLRWTRTLTAPWKRLLPMACKRP